MPLREILAEFGFRVDDAGLKKANEGVNEFAKSLGNIKGLVTGALTGLGLGFLKSEVDDLAKEAGAVSKAAIKSGVGLHEFEKISYQTGLGTEQLTGLFRKLQQNMAAAGGKAQDAATDFADADGGIGQALGTKKAAETFKALGIDLEDAQGKARGSADVFEELVGALGRLPNAAERTAVATRVLGRAGSDILPYLEKSPEKIKALGEQFDALGGFSEENVKSLKEYTAQTKALDLASKSLKIALVSALVPAITFVYEKINAGILWLKKNADTSNLLKIAVIGLAGGFAVLNASALASAASTALAWARVVLPIAVLYLLLDDVIHFLAGDAKTATEDFINALFGIEDGGQIIADIRSSFYLWTLDLNKAKGTLEVIKVLLSGIGGIVSKITDPATWSKGTKQEAIDPETLREEQRQSEYRRSHHGENAPELSWWDKLKGSSSTAGGLLGASGNAKEAFAPVTVKVPGVDYSSKGVTQTINVTQHIEGTDAQDIASKANEGIGAVGKDTARATMAAVKAQK